MTEIASALTGFDFIRKTFKRVAELQKDNETQTVVNDALAKLGEVQDKLFELREENTALQSENARLSGQLANSKAWEARRAQYTLVETAGGAHVFQSDGPPLHYACPACMERGEVHPLQNRKVVSGAWICPGCDKQYPVSAATPRSQLPTSRSGGWVNRY